VGAPAVFAAGELLIGDKQETDSSSLFFKSTVPRNPSFFEAEMASPEFSGVSAVAS
jgi:hypothetical protein